MHAVHIPRSLAFVLLTCFCPGLSVGFSTWKAGDVILSGANNSGEHFVYDHSGGFKESFYGPGQHPGGALHSDGRFYVTDWEDQAVEIYNNCHPHELLAKIPAGDHPESVSFDYINGSFLVGHADGDRKIWRFSACGAFVESYGVETEKRGSDFVKLSSDGRTVFYTSEGHRIMRYDTVTKSQLADFGSVPNRATDLFLLPPGDGSAGLIVANESDIKRLDSNGSIIQSYDAAVGVPAWFGVDLDVNSGSFWACTVSGAFVRFNLQTGAVEVGPIVPPDTASGIRVVRNDSCSGSGSGSGGNGCDAPFMWVSRVRDDIDSGWTVAHPTGSSDYLSVAHSVAPGCPSSEGLAVCQMIAGIGVSTWNSFSSITFPVLGVFRPNLALDSGGCTPDLADPIIVQSSPSLPPPPTNYNYIGFCSNPAVIPAGTTSVIAVVQLPPGNDAPDLLAVGGRHYGGGGACHDCYSISGCSGFSSNAFSTPALIYSDVDLGITVARIPPVGPFTAILRVGRHIVDDPAEGDHLEQNVKPGSPVGIAFFGPEGVTKWRLQVKIFECDCSTVILPLGITQAFPASAETFAGKIWTWGRLQFTWPATLVNRCYELRAIGYIGNAATCISNPVQMRGCCN